MATRQGLPDEHNPACTGQNIARPLSRTLHKPRRSWLGPVTEVMSEPQRGCK
jgi:hypothetical protein